MTIKVKTDNTDADREDKPLYPIGIAAELIGITEQTLRLYEKHGLIKPARRSKRRHYSNNDIKWLRCIRDLIHIQKISIEGIKKLLGYAPCWEITECPEEKRTSCTAHANKSRPCWELNKTICKKESGKPCKECVIYLARIKNR
jgi:MerR family transcriptional regulator/heat shock protein HspR